MSKNRLSIVTASDQGAAALQVPANDARRGKVVHDDRGTAVWDWAVETGVLAKQSTTDLLTSLEQGAPSLECEADPATTWSGDPYNRPAR